MSGDAFPDRLSLIGMRFEARHGVLAEEKADRRSRSRSTSSSMPTWRRRGERDELAATVDYGGLYDLVRAIVEGRRST